MEKNKHIIAVAGTGYVGLSNSILLAQNNKVYAVDILPEKVEMINNRKSPIVDKEIQEYLETKRLDLNATLDAELAYTNAEFVVIATPTNYDVKRNYFDTSSVEAVIKLVKQLNPNAIIIIKSTIPIGYTKLIREKMEFENIIFSDVDSKVNATIEEADRYKENALSEHHEQIMDKYFDYMQDQVHLIQSDIKRQMAKAELSAKRELLLYRNQISEKVFQNVKKQLSDFAQSSDYKTYLMNSIRDCTDSNSFPDAKILVRQEDLTFLKENDFNQHFTIEQDSSIRLGGFILLDKSAGMMIDQSFDSKLNELVSYFIQTSGLMINQEQ